MKRFSIIIPAYNVEEYVGECLDSVLNQSFSDFEIILVNDGSKDGTPEICKRYADKDSRIRYYSKENGGLSHTRNYGIDKALGEYLYFLDSDDILEERALEKLNTIIEKENPDIIVTRFRMLNNINGELTYSSKIPDKILNNLSLSTVEKYEQCCLYGDIPLTATFIVPKLKYINENSFRFCNGILHEDELWTPQIFLNAKTVSFCNESCYRYRINRNGSISNKIGERNLRDKIRVMDELIRLSDEKEISKAVSSCYIDRAACMYAWFINYSKEIGTCPEIEEALKNRIYILKKARQKKYHIFGYVISFLGVQRALAVFSKLI
ncbi:MAG: glycosyltransferase [Lachnospiraceae bacterium]|nr:glycosyltransferase [Lachnospiraceae bacterium]